MTVASFPTPLDVAAQVDPVLRREISWAAASPAVADVGLARNGAGILGVTDGAGAFTGRLLVGAGSAASVALQLNAVGTGIFSRTANRVGTVTGGTQYTEVGSNGLAVRSDTTFGVIFRPGTIDGTACDAGLNRVAAGIVGATDGNSNATLARFRTGNGTAASPALQLGTAGNNGWHLVAATPALVTDIAGVAYQSSEANIHRYASSLVVGWSSTTDPTVAADTTIRRGAAGIVLFGSAIRTADRSAATPALCGTTTTTTGIYFPSPNIGFSIAATAEAVLSAGFFNVKAAGAFSWSSTADPAVAADTSLVRVGAAIVGVQNGAGAGGALRVGDGTAALPSLNFAGSTTTGLYQAAAGAIGFSAAAVGIWKIDGTGLQAVTDNSFDIGATGATRPRTLYLGTSLQIEADRGALFTNQTDNANGTVATVAGTAGDPVFWLRIKINGNNRAIPCY